MSSRTIALVLIALAMVIGGGALALGLTGSWSRTAGEPAYRFALERRLPLGDLPTIEGPGDPASPLVVIDAGHGGRDLGAVWRGTRGEEVFEKDIVLGIAMRLKQRLLDADGVRVAMTRSDDQLIALGQRPEIARMLDADLFLSIHADSAGSYSDVAGASVYTLSDKASSEAAARFARRENAAGRVNGITVEGQSEEVSTILVELSQQRTQEEAAAFAALIEREGEGRIPFHPQARRSAALAVLRAPDVPGVLFESGFVTNAGDRARLMTEEGRDEFAQVLAQAIRVYFARRNPG